MDVAEHVDGAPRRRARAQHRELVRDGGGAAGAGRVDPGGVGLDRRPRAVAERVEVAARGAVQPDAAREAVDGDCVLAHELGQRAARDPQQRLELEGTVLGVTEPEAEEDVRLARRAHVRARPSGRAG